MQRFKTADATGVAPDGRFYAGDFNELQDLAAAQSDFTQVIDTGELHVGEAGLALVRYGAGEARLSGAMRVDGILRGLGGIYAGTFTSTARDALGSGLAPTGLVILNSSTNRMEWNSGTDAARTWRSLAADASGNIALDAGGMVLARANSSSTPVFGARLSGDSVDRIQITSDGIINLQDMSLQRLLLNGVQGTVIKTSPLQVQAADRAYLRIGNPSWNPSSGDNVIVLQRGNEDIIVPSSGGAFWLRASDGAPMYRDSQGNRYKVALTAA